MKKSNIFIRINNILYIIFPYRFKSKYTKDLIYGYDFHQIRISYKN